LTCLGLVQLGGDLKRLPKNAKGEKDFWESQIFGKSQLRYSKKNNFILKVYGKSSCLSLLKAHTNKHRKM